MHRIRLSIAAALLCAAIPAAAAPRLEITPGTFDFGWSPDNAKITADFTLHNTGEEIVPLKEVIPTCGCTAANFSPTDVASNEETKVSLTFNTRGYTNMKFHKAARVLTSPDDTNPYVANLAGHVTDAAAKLIPEGSGIAEFPPTATGRTAKIVLVNKTGRDVTLKVVQPAAAWVTANVPSSPIKNGEKATVEISIDGSTKDLRTTSLTLAPSDFSDQDRVTLAVRTGPPPADYRMPPPAPKKAAPAPEKKPAAKPATSPAKAKPAPAKK